MVDLNSHTGTVSMDIFAELEQTRQIIVVIDTQLSGTVGALRRVHTGVFHDDQTGTSFGTLLVIVNMKKTHFTVLLPVVGTHRHHGDTVFDSHIFHRQWGEDMLIIAFHKETSLRFL